MNDAGSAAHIEHLLRELAPQVLGAVARRCADFAVAEDVVQEALLAAAVQWPQQGIARNPRGWLYHVAMRRLTDQLRSELARRRREDDVAREAHFHTPLAPGLEWTPDTQEDDSLLLLFMSCHPSLTPPSAIALTLRAVGGLTTAEIARAFLVPETTMAQRISRAKQTIKASNISFSMPNAAERAKRLGSVLHVLYLIFNEGYASSSGDDLQRPDLSNEAIRLARAVYASLPDESEVAGLLALMLLNDARKAARTGASGELIPLDEQDRSLWNRAQIAEGVALLSQAFARGSVGYYQLQAPVAAVHDQAASMATTDWPQILQLYDLLLKLVDNPMVGLNRAVAVAMVHGPAVGLRLLDELEDTGKLAEHYRLDAVRAHMLEQAGEHERALMFYRRAAERTASLPERNYLTTRAARLNAATRA